MAYKVPFRVCRTTDGRLVREGDPEAAFLAYPEGEELADEEAKRSGLLELCEPEPKAAPKPQDKSGAVRANKAAKPEERA